MAKSQGFPPYCEFLLYDDVLERLTPGEVKVMCWMLGNATPAGEGSWSVSVRMQDLERKLDMTAKTLRKHLAGLSRTGYLHIEKSVPQGKGLGATPQTYYLTHHPSLGRPDVPPDGDRVPRNGETFSLGKNSLGKSSPGKERNVYRLPVAGSVRAEGNSPPASTPPPVVLDLPKQSPTGTATPGGENPLPSELRSALLAIGWNFAAFDVPEVPHEVLFAGARYAKAHRLGAAWLNSMVRNGNLEDVLRADGALGVDPQRTLGEPLPAPGRLSGYEYDILAERHPDWAHEVRLQAERLLPPGAKYVPPSLLWEVAYRMPPNAAPATETSG